MRNFHFNDDDHEDVEHDEYDDEYEIDPQIVEWMQVDFISVDLNHRLLATTIKMLEKSFWWRFRKLETKLRIISETYEIFNVLIQEDEDESEE